MRVDFYGILFETPSVTIYLWSPWRAAAAGTSRLRSGRRSLRRDHGKDADEIRLHIGDSKTWKQALNGMCRVLKGWQEEAEQGRERRAWRWLLEGDVDDHGYDHAGEPAGLWAFLQLGLERGNFDDPEKMETVDLGRHRHPHRSASGKELNVEQAASLLELERASRSLAHFQQLNREGRGERLTSALVVNTMEIRHVTKAKR